MKSAGVNPVEQDFKNDKVPVADKKHLIGLMDHLEASLNEAGYFFPTERRETMAQTVRNIFTHMKLKEQEIQTLRGVIAAIERRWQRKSEK